MILVLGEENGTSSSS